MWQNVQAIGVGLVGFGIAFIFFGYKFFFNTSLLVLGNILFILGLPFAIGLQRTYEFAFQLHNVQAICIFMAGIFIVLIRWPVIGMFVEIIGFFLLLRGSFQEIKVFLEREIQRLQNSDLFVSSILPFLIELETTVRVFFQNHKLIATGLIMGTISIGIVLLGKPFIGICAVIGGFFLLFIGFLSAVIDFYKKDPEKGNLLSFLYDSFVSRLSFVIELERKVRFFLQKHELIAIAFIVGGIYSILLGWRVIGMCVVIYGFFLLFGNRKTEMDTEISQEHTKLL